MFVRRFRCLRRFRSFWRLRCFRSFRCFWSFGRPRCLRRFRRFRRFRPRYLNRPCRDVYRFVVIAAWGRDFRNGVFALRLRRPDQRGDQRARRVGFISAAFAASVGLDIGGEEGDAGLSARYGNFISVYRGGGVSSRFCVDFVQSVVRAFVGRRAGMRAEF